MMVFCEVRAGIGAKHNHGVRDDLSTMKEVQEGRETNHPNRQTMGHNS